jgi:hypothetical protein
MKATLSPNVSGKKANLKLEKIISFNAVDLFLLLVTGRAKQVVCRMHPTYDENGDIVIPAESQNCYLGESTADQKVTKHNGQNGSTTTVTSYQPYSVRLAPLQLQAFCPKHNTVAIYDVDISRHEKPVTIGSTLPLLLLPLRQIPPANLLRPTRNTNSFKKEAVLELAASSIDRSKETCDNTLCALSNNGSKDSMDKENRENINQSTNVNLSSNTTSKQANQAVAAAAPHVVLKEQVHSSPPLSFPPRVYGFKCKSALPVLNKFSDYSYYLSNSTSTSSPKIPSTFDYDSYIGLDGNTDIEYPPLQSSVIESMLYRLDHDQNDFNARYVYIMYNTACVYNVYIYNV